MPNDVPKVAILERLLVVVNEGYFLYDMEAPAQVERWDLRSMLDYAVLSAGLSCWQHDYTTFYLHRNTVMQLLMEMVEAGNYGEWRMWETERERTRMDIERVITRTLEAERKRLEPSQ